MVKKVLKGKGLDKLLSDINIGQYSYKVGILQNKQHFAPARDKIGTRNGKPVYRKYWTKYAGLNVLKHGPRVDGTLYSIAKELEQKYKWLTRPFTIKNNQNLLNVIRMVVEQFNGKGSERRIVNALQAVIRNPILRGDYGKNSRKTAKAKGFNKLMICTAQFFRNIMAKRDV